MNTRKLGTLVGLLGLLIVAGLLCARLANRLGKLQGQTSVSRHEQWPTVPANTGSLVPQGEAQEALTFHNAKRREVGAPPLEWSAALAANAQIWANHLASDGACQLVHQKPNSHGENLFASWGRVSTALDASEAWYNEIHIYQYGVVTLANYHPVGHYTQLVWKSTRQVGIGQATCNNGAIVIAAEYDPPGNYIGETPY